MIHLSDRTVLTWDAKHMALILVNLYSYAELRMEKLDERSSGTKDR